MTPGWAVGDPDDGRGGHGGSTGHPDVDWALAGLDDLDTLPPAEQVERYAETHRTLQQTLRGIDVT